MSDISLTTCLIQSGGTLYYNLTSNVIIQLVNANLRAKLEDAIPLEESLRNENCESRTVC
jgi:hypothetical protein